MSRPLPLLALLLLPGCVTNTVTNATISSQRVAQLAANGMGGGGGGAPPQRPTPPAPVMTPAAQLTSARLVTVSKVTTEGSTLSLASLQSLNRDCTPLGKVTAKLVTPAGHGTVTIADGTSFSNFSPADPPYACNSRRTPATLVTYTADAGFTGQDTAVVSVFFPDGKAPTIRFDITVR